MNGLKIMAMARLRLASERCCKCKFSYTKETQDIKLGPSSYRLRKQQTVNVPCPGGVAAIQWWVPLYASKKQ